MRSLFKKEANAPWKCWFHNVLRSEELRVSLWDLYLQQNSALNSMKYYWCILIYNFRNYRNSTLTILSILELENGLGFETAFKLNINFYIQFYKSILSFEMFWGNWHNKNLDIHQWKIYNQHISLMLKFGVNIWIASFPK